MESDENSLWEQDEARRKISKEERLLDGKLLKSLWDDLFERNPPLAFEILKFLPLETIEQWKQIIKKNTLSKTSLLYLIESVAPLKLMAEQQFLKIGT